MFWATFWAIFLQLHLVTLLPSNQKCEKKLFFLEKIRRDGMMATFYSSHCSDEISFHASNYVVARWME
jgi:hypothetical protein